MGDVEDTFDLDQPERFIDELAGESDMEEDQLLADIESSKHPAIHDGGYSAEDDEQLERLLDSY